ncbi:unnamed protein product [Boreogadus saida]
MRLVIQEAFPPQKLKGPMVPCRWMGIGTATSTLGSGHVSLVCRALLLVYVLLESRYERSGAGGTFCYFGGERVGRRGGGETPKAEPALRSSGGLWQTQCWSENSTAMPSQEGRSLFNC